MTNIRKKIISWNCQGIKAKSHNLQSLIKEYNPDIICLQETQINPQDSNPIIKGYEGYFFNRATVTRGHGGTAVLVKPRIPQEHMNLQSNLQSKTVKVAFKHPLSITSIYIPEADWRNINKNDIKNLIQSIPNPKIITGDWNARNTIWFSDNTCSKGEDLEEIFDELNMIVIDQDKPTHISTAYNSSSHIDVTITSPSMATSLEWNTLDDTYGSDHFPIEIILTIANNEMNQRPRWNFNKANWAKFNQELKLEIPQQISNIEDLVNNVTNKLIAAAKNSIPLHETFPRKIPVPWWNDECKRAKIKRSQALKDYKKDMSVVNAIAFKKEKAKTTLVFNIAKKNSWISYVSKLTRDTPITKVWKRIARIQGKRSSTTIKFLKSNNTVYQTKIEIADALATNFQTQQSTKNSTRAFLNVMENSNTMTNFPVREGQHESYNEDFKLQELKEAIKSAGNTSMGEDMIHYQILKHLTESDMKVLLDMYNHIWNSGSYPNQWKKAIVIPILKKNKDPSSPTSYRPISLTSCLSKIFDKLINKRLYWILETQKLLPREQSGFRKGRSTIDNLIYLENEIRWAILNKQFLTAVFLDIEKAYDSCWEGIIIKELHRFKLKGKLPCRIMSFLQNRRLQVNLDEAISQVKKLGTRNTTREHLKRQSILNSNQYHRTSYT